MTAVVMTVDQFLEWPGDGTGTKYQLVDGNPRAMAPAGGTHGTIQATVARILENHLVGKDSPCRTVTEPGIVSRVRSKTNQRIPDLAVTDTPDDLGQRSLPDPVLIVEILSPSNEAEMRENIWAFASIPSVREILVLDSVRVAAELWRRAADGAWPENPEELGADSELVLHSIGLEARLSIFYARTHLRLPD